MTKDTLNYNGLSNILTIALTVKEAKAISKRGLDMDEVIATSPNSYNPLKEDYIASIMSAFFYLHYLNATSSANRWVRTGNWRQKLDYFTDETAEQIKVYMGSIND